MVPILSSKSALGQAVAQQIHDETCGSSPASAQARASRYFYFCPPAGNLFKELQQGCFKCRRLRMVKGKDLINPLRHLSDTTMVPGISLQFDIAGPWLVKTKSKQATLLTRQEKKEKRSTTKMWILLAVDYFTSKLDEVCYEEAKKHIQKNHAIYNQLQDMQDNCKLVVHTGADINNTVKELQKEMSKASIKLPIPEQLLQIAIN